VDRDQGRSGAAIDPDHRGYSYALNGEEQIARAAGCDDYVPKSFSPLANSWAKIRQHPS
jgi:CheY-like chemotaxis protein